MEPKGYYVFQSLESTMLLMFQQTSSIIFLVLVCVYISINAYSVYHLIIFSFIADVLQSSFSQASEYLVYLPLGCNRYSNKLETVYPVSTLLLESEIDLMTDYAKEVMSMLPISPENEE